MTRYHSLTCETVCPGWGCECWCHDCPDEPAPEHDSTATNGKIGHSKTAPAGNRGLSPTEAAKPHGRTCIT